MAPKRPSSPPPPAHSALARASWPEKQSVEGLRTEKLTEAKGFRDFGVQGGEILADAMPRSLGIVSQFSSLVTRKPGPEPEASATWAQGPAKERRHAEDQAQIRCGAYSDFQSSRVVLVRSCDLPSPAQNRVQHLCAKSRKRNSFPQFLTGQAGSATKANAALGV